MLELTSIANKELQVKKPDGSVLELKIRNFTLRTLKDKELELANLTKKHNNTIQSTTGGKLDVGAIVDGQTSIDYLLDIMSLSIDDMNRDDFMDLEMSHINLIREEIDKLTHGTLPDVDKKKE